MAKDFKLINIDINEKISFSYNGELNEGLYNLIQKILIILFTKKYSNKYSSIGTGLFDIIITSVYKEEYITEISNAVQYTKEIIMSEQDEDDVQLEDLDIYSLNFDKTQLKWDLKLLIKTNLDEVIIGV